MPETQPVHVPIAIHFDGAMHLGTGRAEGLVHRTVRRAADGRPYVPGSALKGALRMTAERVIGQLNRIFVDVKDAPEEWRLGRQRRGSQVRDERCRGPAPESMCQSRNPCLVCRVFGNVFTGTRLHVDDAEAGSGPLRESMKELLQLQSDEEEETQRAGGRQHPRASSVDTFTRLSVSRRRKGAEKGALFTSEYSRPESVFETTLEGDLPLTSLHGDKPPAELVLLAATLAATDQIGGEATTGHGRCTIRVRPPTDKTRGKQTIVPASARDETESSRESTSFALDDLLSEEAIDALAWFRAE